MSTTTFHQLLQNDAVPLTLESVVAFATSGGSNAFNHFIYWARRVTFVGMNLDAEGRIVSYVYEDAGRRARQSEESSPNGVILVPREGLIEALQIIATSVSSTRRRNRLTTIYLYLLLNILRQKRYKVYSCSQSTLAAELGTTQPHLSRYLNQLISCGLIEYSRRAFSISEGVSRSYKLPLSWYGKLKTDYNWF